MGVAQAADAPARREQAVVSAREGGCDEAIQVLRSLALPMYCRPRTT